MPKTQTRLADLQPIIGLMLADVALNAVYQPVCGLELSRPGVYEFDSTMVLSAGTITGSVNTLFKFEVTPAPMRIAIASVYWRSPSTVPFLQLVQTSASSGISISTASNVRARLHANGCIVCAGPVSVIVSARIGSETASVRAGSFARAQLRPAS